MQPLLEIARTFLQTAREELEQGLSSGNYVKVRDAAEKAWNAVIQATDHAMKARGRTPLPGQEAHRDRRNFLEEIGRRDLLQKYVTFSERLHGDVFYWGSLLPAATLHLYLDDVEDYIRQVSEA